MTQTEIEKTTDAPLAVQPVSIEALLGAALAEGRSADEVKQIHELMKDVQAQRALGAFNRAFVEFKKDCPPIPRTKRTEQYTRVTDDGRKVSGAYADLEGIAKVVDPVLRAFGLSYRWTNTTLVDGEMTVTCRLAHVDGHYEDSPSPPFPVGPVNRGQSAPQASASVSTYARRYSLISALGLTTVDEDDDGRGENGEPVEAISEEQAHHLNDKLIEAEADKTRFLKWARVGSLGEITTDKYEACVREIQRKIDANRRDGT